MNKSMVSMISAVDAATAVAGAATYWHNNQKKVKKTTKKFRRNAKDALKNTSAFISDVSHMF